METGKPGLASAPVHISSVTAQMEKSMDIQAPLTAVYIHTVPSLPAQPYPQTPAATQETATLHLAMPPLYSKETLPFLTLHIAGGLQSQPGLCLAASAPTARPKSAGKHVCPHCGRDCMKPSVLEKHLRCHTGERPYPCATCGVSFKTQSNLYKHKRTQAHARLSSESGLSSLDSMSSSRETSASSLSLDDSGSVEKDATLPANDCACPASIVKTLAAVSEQNALNPADQDTEASAKVTTQGEKQRMEKAKAPVSTSRHLPLQRQEATLFSKQWESSVSRGKSQSHESTDSGFSESSDHYPSPGSVLPDHSMDSLTESTKHLEEITSTQTPSGPDQGVPEPKCTATEQKTLEERISKLISENTAVVEDKKLENVRPRKTVLSKQGSIDLPMPYTYKDSFHFDMKISKTPNVGLQRTRKPDFYSSVPTQRSNTMEHAPLTRSNSLPFSVTLLQPEGSSPSSSYQSDYVTLVRRGSSGQINPTSFTMKPVNQHFSTHHPLVRQTAVDGNHATDGLLTNSSAEEACTRGLSCDGDGADICGEPSNRKFRRKKTQKFAYNKWYMYGGGTFKKLYGAEKSGDDGVAKGRKYTTNPEHEAPQGLQRRSSVMTTVSPMNYTSSSSATMCPTGCLPSNPSLTSAVDLNLKTSSSLKTPLRRNLSLSVLPVSSIGSLVSHQTDLMSGAEAGRMIDGEKQTASTSQLCGTHIPSDRKKQKTDDKMICPLETDTNTPAHPLPSVTGSAPHQATNHSYIKVQNNHTQINTSFPTCIINTKTPTVSCSVSSARSVTKATFLPKYQLKLPNAAEPESTSSLHVMDKQSSHSEKTSPLARTSENKRDDTFTAPTTISLVETSRLDANAASIPAVVPRQFAATIATTTCIRNEQAGLCSTLTQPLKSAGGLAPVQSPRFVASVVTHFPAAPTTTTANNMSSDSAVEAFSQPYRKSTPSPSHTRTDQLNPVNSSNTPVVPCHIAPFDQPDAHNVFHVHTADLQICLQIISDEQLALIEPQIERHMGSGLSQRCDAEQVDLEVIQNKTQSSVTMPSSNHGGDHEQELDQSESSPTIPLSAQLGKAEPALHLTEHSTQTTVSAESTPPEVQDSSLHPHKYDHVNTVAMTHSADEVMSTEASLKGVKSGRSQASEEQHALFLNCCTKEQLLPDIRVSQGGLITQTNSIQPKLRISEESKLKGQATPGSDLSGSSFNQCKASRQLNTHCNNPADPTSVALDSSKHANMGYDRAESSPIYPSSQEVTRSEIQDIISPTFSEKQHTFISMSSNIPAERPQNIPAVLTHIQSPAAGESGEMKMDEVPQWLDQAESNCTKMCSPETIPKQGEDGMMKVDSFQSSWLSEQLLQHPTQTHLLSPQSPQSPPSQSNNLHSGCSQSSLFISPQPQSEVNNIYASQQQWESGSQRRQNSHQSDSSPCIKAQEKSTAIQSNPLQTQTQVIAPVQRTHSAAKLPIGSTSPDTNTPPSTQPSQVSHSVQASGASAGSTAETKVLDNNTVLSFTYTEPADYQDKAASDYSKYQSFQSECLTSGLRPVQSCQDYPEDTSSSDDEGKLIIEL